MAFEYKRIDVWSVIALAMLGESDKAEDLSALLNHISITPVPGPAFSVTRSNRTLPAVTSMQSPRM
jgi:hypothetical protein